MFDSEIPFVTKYFQTRLKVYDQFDFSKCTTDELHDMASEASSLRKILFDYNEEGYTELSDSLNSEFDISNRLGNFLDEALPLLGGKSERELFCLYAEPVSLNILKQSHFKGGPEFELIEYLSHLDSLADQPPDISKCFENKNQMKLWLAKTNFVLSEMSEYLLWIIKRLQQRHDAVPVLMLRDTLLIYFGIMWARRQGVSINKPEPLLMSRKFVGAVTGSEDMYLHISGYIFHTLLHNNVLSDLTMFRDGFIKKTLSDKSIDSRFVKASRDYLSSLTLSAAPLIIESGIHGVFPLWLLALNNNKGDFLLYSTAPWLYPIYKDILFRQNYNGLRDIETIVIHEHLFQIKDYCNGKVIVEEARNPVVMNLALYELCLFKKLAMQKLRTLD